MEIEVGDYIRTKKGLIRKVQTIKSGKRQFTRTTETLINGRFKLEDIAKHSKNIIDLIEVGDILEIKEGNDICYLGLEKDTTTVNYNDIKEDIRKGTGQLLSILTKEQYNQKCYKLEE